MPEKTQVNQNMVEGESKPSFPYGVAYKSSQDFKEIRSRCLAEDRLFEDPEFPLSSDSRWLRPSEISNNPQFFIDGPCRFDVNQGNLGDCWLLAAIANMTLNKKLFHQVVPDDQSFDKDYAGIFHFRFWQFGHWVNVVIDDRLPTYSQGNLKFLYPRNKNEYWSALLEKAFAKLYGSYADLNGNSKEAMISISGGIAESYGYLATNFDTMLLKAYERNSLMVANKHWNRIQGLPAGHAYSITRIKYVDIKTPEREEKILLVRIRNPWGRTEWNGAWSDKSPKWNNIPQSEKEELGLTVNDDGEFWMSFEDFLKNFDGVNICHWDPKESPKGCTKKWESSNFVGEWVKGVTASGCSRNPQFTVTLTEPDEGDVENKCTMIVALRHPLNRQYSVRKTIGYKVYKLPHNKPVSMPIDVNAFKHYCVGSEQGKGDITARFRLEPGMYAIAPSNKPDLDGKFMIRVFSENANMLVAHVGDLRDADE